MIRGIAHARKCNILLDLIEARNLQQLTKLQLTLTVKYMVESAVEFLRKVCELGHLSFTIYSSWVLIKLVGTPQISNERTERTLPSFLLQNLAKLLILLLLIVLNLPGRWARLTTLIEDVLIVKGGERRGLWLCVEVTS